jgi:hypothetical protein
MKHVFAFPLFYLKGNILWVRYLSTAGKLNGSVLSVSIHSFNDSYSTLHLYFFKPFCRFGLKYPDKYLTNRGRQFWRFQSSGMTPFKLVFRYERFGGAYCSGTGSPVSEDFVTPVFRMVQNWPLLKMNVALFPGNTGIHLRITWFRVLEDWEFHQRRCENLATTVI